MSGQMSQDEFDARMDAGEDPYGLVGEDYRRRGWIYEDGRYVHPLEKENQALRSALEEAIGWARRPDPLPLVPFDEFLQRMGGLGVGPRGASPPVPPPAQPKGEQT